MSEYREYGMFIKGEIRVDGWKSDWRKDLDAYRASKQTAPIEINEKRRDPVITKVYRQYVRPPMTDKQIEEHRASARRSRQNKRLLAKEAGYCVDCFKFPAIEGITMCDRCRQYRIDSSKLKKVAA